MKPDKYFDLAAELRSVVLDCARGMNELQDARAGLDACDRDAYQEQEEDERLQRVRSSALAKVVEQYTHAGELRKVVRVFVDKTIERTRRESLNIPMELAPAWSDLIEVLELAEKD